VVDRRTALKAIGGVPLVAAGGQAALAAAKTSNISLSTSMQNSVGCYLAVPNVMPAPSVLLIHEWWGLNDQIKQTAVRFADEGYLSLAVDLYKGQVAKVPDDARSLTQQVDANEALDTLTSWIAWLREHSDSTGKVGTVGWCFGGGWSLNASIATPVDATVIYYGRCNASAAETAKLHGPLMGHFATRDQWINRKMVSDFEQAMNASGKTYQNFWYEADHAFANPTSVRHDQEDAALAWTRTLEFFATHLS